MPSLEEVDRLRRHHEGLGIDFVQGLAGSLPFKDGSFDRVVMHGVVTILPSEDEVRIALSGNLCRCTGYDGIVRAVLAASSRP